MDQISGGVLSPRDPPYRGELHFRRCSVDRFNSFGSRRRPFWCGGDSVCDAIMAPERNFSETSPLLGPQGNGHPRHTTTGAINNGPPQPRTSECPERDHDTEEEQLLKDSAHARNALRYIVPAISIGV